MQQTRSGLSITRIVHYRSRWFQDAMRIYQAEFSADSRLSVTTIRALLAAGQYQLFVTQEQGTVLGFALIWISRRPAFVHLDYIGVRHEQKGRGIGTWLYRWLTSHLHELSPRASLLTLEVENELIPFYRRSDTRILEGVAYLFPGPFGPLPMHLMVHDREQRQVLERMVVQGVIRGLYRGLHQRAAGDPLLRSLLIGVPRIVRLV
ncbi:MAG: GNAT family N-acetyltransferase [Deltaproteobacteria bacterium]|nr:GNAT family N-acetyltransferase [Deltaproteobacteria bacterium]